VGMPGIKIFSFSSPCQRDFLFLFLSVLSVLLPLSGDAALFFALIAAAALAAAAAAALMPDGGSSDPPIM